MSFFDTINESVNEFIKNEISRSATLVTEEQWTMWPLDYRARPHKMFIASDAMIVPKGSVRMLDYYGGFEYVDAEYRVELGDYVVFSSEDERVAEVLDALYERNDIPCD